MPQLVSPVSTCFQRPVLLHKSFCVRTSLSVEQIPNHLAIWPCYRASFLSVSVLPQDSVSSHVCLNTTLFVRKSDSYKNMKLLLLLLTHGAFSSVSGWLLYVKRMWLMKKNTSLIKTQLPSHNIRERSNVLYWYQTYVGSCGLQCLSPLRLQTLQGHQAMGPAETVHRNDEELKQSIVSAGGRRILMSFTSKSINTVLHCKNIPEQKSCIFLPLKWCTYSYLEVQCLVLGSTLV